MHLPREGGTLHSHLIQAKKSGAKVPELTPPETAKGSEYLFQLWREIYRERDSSFTLQPIKIRDIMLYSEAMGIKLEPFEIKCIMEIDSEYVQANNK